MTNEIKKSVGASNTFFAPRFSVKEQALFAKRMSFLVKAGVPLVEALSLIQEQTKSKSKARAFELIIDDVNNGQFLALSLVKHKRMFGDFAINLIRVGEESGILSQNLEYLAEELKKKEILRRKVLGALAYPIIITVATFGITGALILYVFPKILPIFSSLHVNLPLSTRILIALSNFLIAYGLWLMLGIVIFVSVFFFIQHKFESVRLFVHRAILSLPIFGNLLRSYNLANFTRSLGLLLRSGVRLTNATIMLAETTPNLAYRRKFEKVTERVLHGEPMSRELGTDSKLFPDLVPHMIAIGESTGSLSQTLLYLSELYESEVEEQTKNLSTAIEPVLMIVMGVLVGFIAVSIITPIYEITQNLHP